MEPVNRWNPGWQQFVLNQQRVQAGGNRQFLAVPPPVNQFMAGRQPPIERNAQQRRINAPVANQNRRNQNRANNNNNNNNTVRRDNRNQPREPMTRDELERIEAITRKSFQTRTALEYDNREDQCWTNILSNIESKAHQFSTSSSPHLEHHNGGDIFVPNEEKICSILRSENQNESIMTTRELLLDFGATEEELNGALANLEIHLRTNAAEYNTIEELSGELIKSAGRLTSEIDELEDILRRIDKIRLQK